jgi:hypothetical protein
MLEGLFGNRSAERVLLFLENYGEGFAGEIARTFETQLYSIQKQLQRFENEGILVSQLKGKTRIFTWNPRYAFKKELRVLLSKALTLLPQEEQRRYFRKRMRPRRTGKPL